MIKQTKIQAQSIRFRRWSRAGFAVFCSLSSLVTIGCLAVSIADRSVQKCITTSIIQCSGIKNESSEIDSDLLPSDVIIEPTSVVLIHSVSTDEVACYSINKFIHPNG